MKKFYLKLIILTLVFQILTIILTVITLLK